MVIRYLPTRDVSWNTNNRSDSEILTWKIKKKHQNEFPRHQSKFAEIFLHLSHFPHRNKNDQVFVLPEQGPVLNKTQNPLPRTKSFSSGVDLPIPKLSSSLCVFDVSSFGQAMYRMFKLGGKKYQKINNLIKGGLIWMRDWPGLLRRSF